VLWRCWWRAHVQLIALPLMDAVTTYGSIVSRVEAVAIHAL
jgi:hypothetical protein